MSMVAEWRLRSLALAAVAVVMFSAAPVVAQAQTQQTFKPEGRTVQPLGVSRPLRQLPKDWVPKSSKRQVPNNLLRRIPGAEPEVDRVAQRSVSGPQIALTAGLNFPGLGQGDYGHNVGVAPPDTVGEVGTTQYVQWVNVSMAVFDKANGALLAGPVAGNALFADLGNHPCALTNSGDPIVIFDQAAQRWVLSQFAVQGPYYECVAVSKTADATGEYYLYAFEYEDFNDYPKMSVWHDGYYVTYNMFDGQNFSFVGSRICALERAKMLLGQPAREVCYQLDGNYYSLLPSDADGAMPVSGTPNYVLDIANTSSLSLFKFTPNYATPAASTFTGPTSIPVARFAQACRGGNCIPQPDTNNQLDSLSSMLMFRNAWRKRGSTESLVVSHAVGRSVSGIRWYELRPSGSSLAVFQQSTYTPDSDYRWMSSAAMDKNGNIAVGYSLSSSARYPSIAVTGRLAGDPVNTLQAENILVSGSGAQTGGLTRWGDYASMTVDPVDDCTFWFTTEYARERGSFNWATQIMSFKLPGCS